MGHCPTIIPTDLFELKNMTLEQRHEDTLRMQKNAKEALNQRAHDLPPDQYHVKDKVWLDAKNLSLLHASVKLASKCHGPFQILQQISLVAYRLQLPPAWCIHDVFHT